MTQNLADIGAPFEAQQLADWLVEGKPELGWRGDPRLSLHIGVATAAHNGAKDGKYYRKGDIVGMRLEVHRHNEDGTDTEIVARPIDKLHEIIPSLLKQDPRTPGFEPVMDGIERESDKLAAEKSTEFQEMWGQMTEHQWHAYGMLPKKVGF